MMTDARKQDPEPTLWPVFSFLMGKMKTSIMPATPS